MRGRLAALLVIVAPAQAAAEPKGYCPGGETVTASGIVSEVTTTDPESPEIILERSTGPCTVDAIRVGGAVPSACAEGGRVTGEGMVQQSRDGTWTWIETDAVRCE